MNSENQKLPVITSLIQNPADVELAAFILNNGYSIRDFYLYLEISRLLQFEWNNIDNSLER